MFNQSLAPHGCPPLLPIATSLHAPLFVLPFVEPSWRLCECWASLRVPLVAKLSFYAWHWLGSLYVHHVPSPICIVLEYYASLNVWPLRIEIMHMERFFVVVHGCWHKNISGVSALIHSLSPCAYIVCSIGHAPWICRNEVQVYCAWVSYMHVCGHPVE